MSNDPCSRNQEDDILSGSARGPSVDSAPPSADPATPKLTLQEEQVQSTKDRAALVLLPPGSVSQEVREPSTEAPTADPEKPKLTLLEEQAQSSIDRAALVLFLAVLWSGCSVGLILYTQYLMQEDIFPYAPSLVFCQTLLGSVLILVLLALQPRLFPAIVSPGPGVVFDLFLVFRRGLPMAGAYALSVVLSSEAYRHSSVSFLQMIKEANVLFVYVLSIVLALDKPSWNQTKVIVLILFATTMTIKGEQSSLLAAFFIQGASQIFESVKILLQASPVNAQGGRLDPFTNILLVMPLSTLYVGCYLLAIGWIWPNGYIRLPSRLDVSLWWPMLLTNALLAFFTNVLVAFLVRHSSAVTFVLVGIIKDAFVLLGSLVVLAESISLLQASGFVLQLALVWVWSQVRLFPAKFADGIVVGLFRANPPEPSPSGGRVSVAAAAALAADYQSFGTGGASPMRARRNSVPVSVPV